jgi:AAA15 family ATPase/GTPase
MIKTLRLRNYKCFLDSTISFRKQTILVGKNNAGKSTLIEALRLISAAGKRSLNSHFSKPLGMYDLPIDYEGIKIDTDKLKIDLRNAIYFTGYPLDSGAHHC